MQISTLNRKYGSGYAGDQDATTWEFYVSKRFQEISRENALSLHISKAPYQSVEFVDDRPVSIVSIKIGFPNFIFREFRWDEGTAINVVFDALDGPTDRAFLTSLALFGYESLHLDPIFRVDIHPKRNGTVYYGSRNLITGEHTLENARFDISDLWMPIPEFDAYDELRRWQREPVFTLANRLIQEAKQRWNFP
jgi:hypothetical protein